MAPWREVDRNPERPKGLADLKITIGRETQNKKASERYVEVDISFDDGSTWSGLVPIEYRRTGLNLVAPATVQAYVVSIAPFLHSAKSGAWQAHQAAVWSKKTRADVTKPLFQLLLNLDWNCTAHNIQSSNPARRYQDLKDMGYTIATKTAVCSQCGGTRGKTFIRLLPLGPSSPSGYQSLSPNVTAYILRVLNHVDAYENRKSQCLLPDHKFPEIRWNQTTPRAPLKRITEAQVKQKFQLLTNQRNQQKREVCRDCFQTGHRGHPFGIPFYYQGGANWPSHVPTSGPSAETGCVGCGWYDLQAWRNALTKLISR